MPSGRELAVDRPPPFPEGQRGTRSREAGRGAPDRERADFRERLDGALRDAGVYRIVAYRDLVDSRFGGNRFAAARGLERLQAEGLLRVDEARGPKGGAFKVVALTPRGKERLDAEARAAGSGQRHWPGGGDLRQAAHDVAVYRACLDAGERIRGEGGRIRRVILDSEFRSRVARRVESARAREGARAAARAKREIAAELHLPLAGGKVKYPDARIEYEAGRGGEGRVDVEVATCHYRAGAVGAKARAGFAVYSAGRGGSLPRTSGGGGGGAGRRDEEGLVEL